MVPIPIFNSIYTAMTAVIRQEPELAAELSLGLSPYKRNETFFHMRLKLRLDKTDKMSIQEP
jgi:LytS/YehU family sensor histidine kinase